MTTIVEALWPRLHATLTGFADRLAAADPTLIRNIGRTANNAFLLRGYLALQRHAGSDEIAITIDVRGDGQNLTFESDACTDSGEVVAVGPSALIPLAEGQTSLEVGIGDWLLEFERFLEENERAVVLAVSGLA